MLPYIIFYTFSVLSFSTVWPLPFFSFQSGMGYVRILFLDVTAWPSDWSYWTSSLWCTRNLRAPVSIREDPSGSIAEFERGRGIVMVYYTSLPLCLIGESFFDFDHTLSFTLSPFSTIWPLVVYWLHFGTRCGRMNAIHSFPNYEERIFALGNGRAERSIPLYFSALIRLVGPRKMFY